MTKNILTPMSELVRPLASFQQDIEQSSGVKLNLKINDNRSTMLSVRWEPDTTKVSLHRIFLNAPQNVMDALACYINKKHKIIAPVVKAYIEDKIRTLDYSYKLDVGKLHTHGNVYNLKFLYDQINHEYFEDHLKLHITWFRSPKVRNRSRITFGLYYNPLKLIKINRIMDSPSFPDYVVAYVIFHEMLHHEYPATVDAKGRSDIHNKEFKEKEREFKYYDLAHNWIKEHKHTFFR